MGTISKLKFICSSVLLADTLTTFVLSWVLQGHSEMETVSCTSFTDVWSCTGTIREGNKGLIHQCHCLYSL